MRVSTELKNKRDYFFLRGALVRLPVKKIARTLMKVLRESEIVVQMRTRRAVSGQRGRATWESNARTGMMVTRNRRRIRGMRLRRQ